MQHDVLVIEHDPISAGLVAHAVRDALPEAAVTVDANAQAASDFLFVTGTDSDRGNNPPRLILMSMSALTDPGVELLRRVRAYTRTQRTPIVVFGSLERHASPLDEAQSTALGVNSYIPKPGNANDFRRAISAAATYWLTLDQIAPTRG